MKNNKDIFYEIDNENELKKIKSSIAIFIGRNEFEKDEIDKYITPPHNNKILIYNSKNTYAEFYTKRIN